MGRGFSATKLVLVLVLLGALYWIGKIVTPAPAGPPSVAKADPAITDKAPSKTKMKDEMMERMQKREDMMKQMREGKAPKPPKQLKPIDDPDQIAITSGKDSFFNHTKPGEAGLEQTEERMDKNKALKEEWQKEAAAAKAAAPPEKNASPESASPESAPHDHSHDH